MTTLPPAGRFLRCVEDWSPHLSETAVVSLERPVFACHELLEGLMRSTVASLRSADHVMAVAMQVVKFCGVVRVINSMAECTAQTAASYRDTVSFHRRSTVQSAFGVTMPCVVDNTCSLSLIPMEVFQLAGLFEPSYQHRPIAFESRWGWLEGLLMMIDVRWLNVSHFLHAIAPRVVQDDVSESSLPEDAWISGSWLPVLAVTNGPLPCCVLGRRGFLPLFEVDLLSGTQRTAHLNVRAALQKKRWTFRVDLLSPTSTHHVVGWDIVRFAGARAQSEITERKPGGAGAGVGWWTYQGLFVMEDDELHEDATASHASSAACWLVPSDLPCLVQLLAGPSSDRIGKH
jgi:hypothetical protein